MKLLFENWRKYLSEIKWEDYQAPKNKWIDIPVEDIETSAKERGGEINLADEIFNLIDTAYKSIGGHFDFQSAGDLPSDYTEWTGADVDGDPEPDALRVSKEKSPGQKMAVAGHDGTKTGIKAYLDKTGELLNKIGYYGEMSKAAAHIMITRYNVPYVNNQQDVEEVLGKTVKWIGPHPENKYPEYDGWYIRKIGGVHEDMKIMLGTPLKIKGVSRVEKTINSLKEEYSEEERSDEEKLWDIFLSPTKGSMTIAQEYAQTLGLERLSSPKESEWPQGVVIHGYFDLIINSINEILELVENPGERAPKRSAHELFALARKVAHRIGVAMRKFQLDSRRGSALDNLIVKLDDLWKLGNAWFYFDQEIVKRFAGKPGGAIVNQKAEAFKNDIGYFYHVLGKKAPWEEENETPI